MFYLYNNILLYRATGPAGAHRPGPEISGRMLRVVVVVRDPIVGDVRADIIPRIVARLHRAGGDEGDVAAAQPELGQGAVVEREELVGGALAGPPAAIPAQQRRQRVEGTDDRSQLAPGPDRRRRDRGVAGDAGAA